MKKVWVLVFCLWVGRWLVGDTNYTTRQGLPSMNVTTLLLDSGGLLWVGTESGLAIIHGETVLSLSPQPEQILLLVERGSSVLAITPTGYRQFKREPTKIVKSWHPFPVAPVEKACIVKNELYLLSKDVWRQENGQPCPQFNPPPDHHKEECQNLKKVLALNFDVTDSKHVSNGWWIGSLDQGLFFLSDEVATVFTDNTKRNEKNPIWGIDIAPDGRWFGSSSSGRLFTGSIENRNDQEVLADLTQRYPTIQLTGLARLRNRLYLTTTEGIFCVKNHQPMRTLAGRTSFPPVVSEEHGFFWIKDQLYDLESGQTLTKSPGLIYCAVIDAGKLWCAGDHWLGCWDILANHWETITLDHTAQTWITQQAITAMAKFGSHLYLQNNEVGTINLAVREQDTHITLTWLGTLIPKEGISSWGLVVDDDGRLWYAHSQGLSVWENQQWRHWGAKNFFDTDFTLGSMIYDNRHKVIALGLTYGVCLVYRDRLLAIPPPPRLQVEGVYAQDQEITLGVLPPNQNSLQIKLWLGRSTVTADTYQYRLSQDGHNFANWIAVTDVIQLNNLRSGNYLLELRAVSYDGLTSPSQTLKWEIQPRWTETWQLPALIGVIVLVISGLLFWAIAAARLRRNRELSEQKLKAQQEKLRDYQEKLRTSMRVTDAMVHILESKHLYTASHARRTTILALNIWQILSRHGWTGIDIRRLVTGALLHDIGKNGIAEAILMKPGRYTEEEFQIMKKHPQIGYDALKNALDEETLDIIRYHHERWDGSGYCQIPLHTLSRYVAIVQMADSIIAICDKRSYEDTRKELTLTDLAEIAISEMNRCRGSQFHPDIVDIICADKDLFIETITVLYSNFVAEEFDSYKLVIEAIGEPAIA